MVLIQVRASSDIYIYIYIYIDVRCIWKYVFVAQQLITLLTNNMNRLLHGHEFALTVYVLLLVTNFTVSVDVRCIDGERLALLELKQGFVDSYGRLSTWGDGEHRKECCNWTGVHCSDSINHVVSLDLRGLYDGFQFLQPLGGIVAPSLSKLDHLTYLDLSCNDFNGVEIPKSIGSLIHLKHLDLSLSYFGGTIPTQLGSLSNLQYLDFHYNRIVGVIPNSLGNLSSLEYLDISFNSETLTSNLEWLPNLTSLHTLALIHVDLGTANTWTKLVTNMTHLNGLFLSDCKLVGSIPEQLGALSQLQHLDLSENSLTGIIPHQLGNLSQLQYLSLRFNKLHGYIPNRLGDLTYLQELDLFGNQLGGTIPKTIGSLSSLTELYLGGNKFNGTVPKSLWDLCNLHNLDLAWNNFNGRLEDFFVDTMGRTPRCSHQSLQGLDLRSNHFTGSIPDLSFFVELQYLGLCDNKLNGTLSDGIKQLSNLELLHIGSNPLQGMITEDHFSKLSKLVYLDMSDTLLSFNISKSWVPSFQLKQPDLSYCKIGPYFPEWLKNQRSIERLSLAHTEIVDILPDWFWRVNGNLPVQTLKYQYIDLSGNQLRGEIHPLFFQADLLNLSANMFTGSIFSMCSMTHYSLLKILDISHNQLSKELPADCWLHFEQLSYVDLSFNNFSGEVPASLLSLPNLFALHLRNNKFGSIPSMSSGNLTILQSLDLSENEIAGFVPSWVGDKAPYLKVLSLRNNNFYGNLPFNICNLTQILVFDLSANHLSGSIPKCFNQFVELSNSSNVDVVYPSPSMYVYRTFNDSIAIIWKGGLADYGSILRLQRLIDLSNNQLTGEIPDEIMDLVELHSLNLSYNKLGGEINPKIGRLQNLDSLDLSWNLLHGPIPPSIAQLNFLGRLNLSFNNLSGKIPIGSHLQTLNDASIYFGNPELCGPPLDRMCTDDRNDNGKSNIIDKEDDNNEDLLDVYGFYIFMAFGIIVGFLTSCGSLIFYKPWRYIFFNFCTSICDNVYVKVIILVNKL